MSTCPRSFCGELLRRHEGSVARRHLGQIGGHRVFGEHDLRHARALESRLSQRARAEAEAHRAPSCLLRRGRDHAFERARKLRDRELVERLREPRDRVVRNRVAVEPNSVREGASRVIDGW